MTSTRYTQGAAFDCLACGASYLPAYPLPLGAYHALARWWVSAHQHCMPLGSAKAAHPPHEETTSHP